MANYCVNRLIIAADASGIERFRGIASGPERPDFIATTNEAMMALAKIFSHQRLALTKPCEKRRRALLDEAGLADDALTLERMMGHMVLESQGSTIKQLGDGTPPIFNLHRLVPVPLAIQITDDTAKAVRWMIDN